MSKPAENTPVLVGIGQSIERDQIVSVVDLAARAAESALADAPGMRERIQRLVMVGVSFSPVGMAPASEVADRLGLADVRCLTTTPGGNTPQWLMNSLSEAIANGELETAMIVGAEATRSIRKSDPGYDFIGASVSNRSGDAEAADEVIGASIRGMVSEHEIKARLVRPADVYPVFESALAARAGASPAEWRERIAAFMSRSSRVAEQNPYAWFRTGKEPSEISEVSESNRITAEPYTKCMNSFANVDQGSALLLTTFARAKEAGLADQCVFPLSGAGNSEVSPSARRDLAAAPAIGVAARAALAAAEVGVDDIDFFDLYSCFPIAVEVGAAEIGLSLDDARGLTLTGGMSFFGGPGNNYASHGIASAALRLRDAGGLAYVSGNGGPALQARHRNLWICSARPGIPPRRHVCRTGEDLGGHARCRFRRLRSGGRGWRNRDL